MPGSQYDFLLRQRSPSAPAFIGKEFRLWKKNSNLKEKSFDLKEKSFNLKLSGDKVHYTSWSLLVIVKHSCSKLHC